MPEVWTHDNLSKHFMPRSNTVFQLFILLCSIVSFMFLFNWRCKITDFLEDQQISLEKSRYKAKCVIHSAKVQVQTNIQFVLWPFTAKTHSAYIDIQCNLDNQECIMRQWSNNSTWNFTLSPYSCIGSSKSK